MIYEYTLHSKKQNCEIAYNIPNIPSNKSHTMYQHALAIAEFADTSHLITYNDPPSDIKRKFDELYVSNSQKASRIPVSAKRIANKVDSMTKENSIYITTFHLRSALSGFFSNRNWVVDVYDDPYQMRFHGNNSPLRYVASFLLKHILKRADGGVNTLHPNAPRLFGNNKKFAMNGCLTSKINPKPKPKRDPVKAIWAGKAKKGWGLEILLESLTQTEVPIHIDIYGHTTEESKRLTSKMGVSENITFHGFVQSEKIARKIGEYHVGLCTLSEFPDWRYSYPIKIGEYLSGGVVPIVSEFPGMRLQAKDSAIYVSSSEELADALEWVSNLDREEYKKMSKRARQRAEEIPWKRERKRFVKQAVKSIQE